MEKYFDDNLVNGIWDALGDGYTEEDISRFLDQKVADTANDYKEDWGSELEMARDNLLDAMVDHMEILTGKGLEKEDRAWAEKMLLNMEKAVTATKSKKNTPKKDKVTKEKKNDDEEALRAFLAGIL